MKTNNIYLRVLMIAVISLLVTIENSQASRLHRNRKQFNQPEVGRCRDRQSSNRDEDSSYSDGELTCGIGFKKTNSELRIVGGRDAKPGEFPFIVRFVVTKENFGGMGCGGVILDERHILTAGHCFANCRDITPVVHVSTYLGDLSAQTEDGEIEVDLARATIHPYHDACVPAATDDLALIELAYPIKFSIKENGYGSVNRVCMPTMSYVTNTTAIIIGWGRTDPAVGKGQGMLQVAEVQIADLDHCIDAWAKNYIYLDPSVHICAHRLDGPQSSCMGDSGGPLLIMNNGKYEVVGITSFGPPTCNNFHGKPSVYTRVANFARWIEANKHGKDFEI